MNFFVFFFHPRFYFWYDAWNARSVFPARDAELPDDATTYDDGTRSSTTDVSHAGETLCSFRN